MRSLSASLALAAVLAVASAAAAEDWFVLGADEGGSVVSIDRAGVKKQGAIRLVKSRWVMGPGDAQRREAVSVEKYDCARGMLSTVELTTTFRDGRVDRKSWDDDAWEPIEEGSTASAIRQEVCQ